MPQHMWHMPRCASMRALLDGDLAEAERLAEEARRAGERAEQPLAAQYYGIQLTQIRSLQGRAAELLPAVRELAERFPGIPAWRTALIRPRRARRATSSWAKRELERFAADDFSAIPKDANWLTGDEPDRRGDRDASATRSAPSWLYEELAALRGAGDRRRPGRRRATARSTGCSACSRWTMGRHDDAERHLEAAIEIATRMGDRPGLALCSRRALAEVLLERGDGGGDRERALELLSER